MSDFNGSKMKWLFLHPPATVLYCIECLTLIVALVGR